MNMVDLEIIYGFGCPLTVHRRCISPMFDICNKIAYNSKMINRTKLPDKKVDLFFEKSAWIDIPGKEVSKKNHYVQEQGEVVLNIISDALVLNKKLPDIFIISPFKSVVDEMKLALRKALYRLLPTKRLIVEKWIEENVGTVHTFQGKEANEVIFLLGCDESSIQAANWVGKSVNMLNVAVSRAKYRFVVIGDLELWQNVSYFNEVICRMHN